MLELRTTRAGDGAAAWPAAIVRQAPSRQWPASPPPSPSRPPAACAAEWREALRLIERHLVFTRRTLTAGRHLQHAGEDFKWLHIVNAGVVKLVNLCSDGRAQVVGLHFKGDWIGFDGLASGQCACDAVAMDTSDVWSVHYTALVAAAPAVPELLQALHVAMSGQLARDREWRLGLGSLSSEARLANFICAWAASLAERQLRTDTIALRMTRMEIGSYLGVTHETVSRAFTRLERAGLLSFNLHGRRQVTIPDLGALADFVQLRAGHHEDTSVPGEKTHLHVTPA